MSAAGAMLLVFQLIVNDGQESHWFVADSGLSREDCETELYQLPLPKEEHGIFMVWSCEAEDHE